jgi:hypothetical protein
LDFPFKGKQKYYNAINKAILAHLKQDGKWTKVIILSIKDKHVCDACSRNYKKIVRVDEASIPPVAGCTNPICRCIYQAAE